MPHLQPTLAIPRSAAIPIASGGERRDTGRTAPGLRALAAGTVAVALGVAAAVAHRLAARRARPVVASLDADAITRERAERARAEQAVEALQEQLRRAQRMETVGRFVGGITHDFNNLLTGILGYCDLALGDGALPAEAREDVTAIRDAARRAAGLTGRILAFSRGNASHAFALDVNDVVEGLTPMLARMIGEHIRFEVHQAPMEGPVLLDPTELEQVVMNLALNARDAMPDGGVLAITTSEVIVSPNDPAHPLVAPGRWAVLEVRDTGVGMDAATQARAHEPFFTTKSLSRGTGLGLATVYGIVHDAGGVVRLDSTPGAGSRFTVYLPRVDASPATAAQATESVVLPDAGHATLLLVEDEDAVRTITRTALERRGYRMLEAADADEALDVAAAHDGEIALLVTDVVLPGMNGRALADALRRRRPSMAVLYVSGYTEDDLRWRGISSETDAVLAKPFTPDSLDAAVRAALHPDRSTFEQAVAMKRFRSDGCDTPGGPLGPAVAINRFRSDGCDTPGGCELGGDEPGAIRRESDRPNGTAVSQPQSEFR